MKYKGTLAIDTETTGLDRMRDRVLFWSMATESERFFFPVSVLPVFDPLFQRTDITWALANAKYDMHLLANEGIQLRGPKNCVIVMDAMSDDTREHGLKEQSWLAYDARWGDFKHLFLDPHIVGNVLGFDKEQYRSFKTLGVGDKLLWVYKSSPKMVREYASCDAFFTLKRWYDLSHELAATPLPTQMVDGFDNLLDYFIHIEQPLTDVLWEMERTGVLVDLDYVAKLDEPMRNGIRGLEIELQQICGRNFNPKSTDHLRDILFNEKNFGLKPIRYTAGGKASVPEPSTDEKSLEILMRIAASAKGARMEAAGQFIKKLLDYRQLIKLHGTYVKGIQKCLGPDGRIHTQFKQAGTRTSRLSSADPNMQNIPRPDPESDPFTLRGMFVAGPGNKLIDKDYPQIEFRVAAVLSGEEKMMDAICKGWDIHNANTSNMFGIDYDKVKAAKKKDKHELSAEDIYVLSRRQEAKTVGLGTMFGEGAAKMAVQLKCSVEHAKGLKQDFFQTYPNIKALIDSMHAFAHDNEYTYTMLGRIRRLHRINNGVQTGIMAEEERQAFNTLVQGSAAELIKLAMLRIHSDKDFRSLGGKLLLSVHDELLSESPEDTAEDIAEIKTNLMSDPYRWGPIQITYPVPITPDGGIGYRWSDSK